MKTLALTALLAISLSSPLTIAKNQAIYDAKKLDQIFLHARSVNEEDSVLRLYVNDYIDREAVDDVIQTLYKGVGNIYITQKRNTYHIQWVTKKGSQHDLILQVLK